MLRTGGVNEVTPFAPFPSLPFPSLPSPCLRDPLTTPRCLLMIGRGSARFSQGFRMFVSPSTLSAKIEGIFSQADVSFPRIASGVPAGGKGGTQMRQRWTREEKNSIGV
ncbi:unnamed protein product [Scytosiphon promiscuus]